MPAETRNVFVSLKRGEDQKWYITDFQITYHINRKDKQTVIVFISEISKGSNTKAFERVKNVKPEEKLKIRNTIEQYPITDDRKIIKAKNIPYTGKGAKPSRTKIYIELSEGKYTYYFLCKNLRG